MQDILLQKSIVLKMERIKSSRKGENVVQSRDVANVNLVIVQLCNSSQALYDYVPALLQQYLLVLSVI